LRCAPRLPPLSPPPRLLPVLTRGEVSVMEVRRKDEVRGGDDHEKMFLYESER